MINKYTSYIPTLLEHCGPQTSYSKEKWLSLQNFEKPLTFSKALNLAATGIDKNPSMINQNRKTYKTKYLL